MQCKDIPDEPILRFLAKNPGRWHNWYFGNQFDVRQAMPECVPEKLVLGKMRMLMRRGLVSGCDCGCRGDFEITSKGLSWLSHQAPNARKEARPACGTSRSTEEFGLATERK